MGWPSNDEEGDFVSYGTSDSSAFLDRIFILQTLRDFNSNLLSPFGSVWSYSSGEFVNSFPSQNR